MQRRFTVRCPSDTPALPPVAAGALQLLPPLAYAHQPASSFNIKFAGQAPSKVRGSWQWLGIVEVTHCSWLSDLTSQRHSPVKPKRTPAA